METTLDKKTALLPVIFFAIILLLQSCGEKTYLNSSQVDDILLKEKVDDVLNEYIKAKKPKIISYEYVPIQTSEEFFQSFLKSSVGEKVSLNPNVTCEIKYKDGKEIKTCEAMAYSRVKENSNGLGYQLVGTGVILNTKTKIDGSYEQQALGYGALITNLFNLVVIGIFIFSLFFPSWLLLTLFVNISSRIIKDKNDTIILAVFISLVLLSLIFGVYWLSYWLLRISVVVTLIACSLLLFMYCANGTPTYSTRLQWIEGVPMNVMYESKTDISFGAMIFSLIFSVIFFISAIIVFFLSNTTIFYVGYLFFIIILTCLLITAFIYMFDALKKR